jgi:hypothetical protein
MARQARGCGCVVALVALVALVGHCDNSDNAWPQALWPGRAMRK